MSLVDRAHIQTATQSQVTYYERVASWAVDGDPTTCSTTDTLSEIYAWWSVDLQDLYSVNIIRILASDSMHNLIEQCASLFN